MPFISNLISKQLEEIASARERDPVPHHPLVASVIILMLLFGAFMTYHIGLHIESITGIPNYIAAAVPWFFVAMFTEIVLLQWTRFPPKAAAYSPVDTWCSLAAGISQLLGEAACSSVYPPFLLYRALEPFGYAPKIFELVRLDSTSRAVPWWFLLLSFICADFVYYWYHRHSHEIAFFWTGHGLHHSSDHFNFSTALRQSWWQGLHMRLWALPLALFIPWEVFSVGSVWVTLYQFWVHTCLVRRLPSIIELVLVTPSSHRVHHDRRLHKNFGGVFSLWDRFFGTFHDELLDARVSEKAMQQSSSKNTTKHLKEAHAELKGEETCLFGIAVGPESHLEPVVQFELWERLLRRVTWICRREFLPGKERRLLPIWKAFAMGPGWGTTQARRPLPLAPPKGIPRLRLNEQVPLLCLLIAWLGLVADLLLFGWSSLHNIPHSPATAKLSAFTLVSLILHASIMNGSRVALLMEPLRWIGLLWFIASQYPQIF